MDNCEELDKVQRLASIQKLASDLDEMNTCQLADLFNRKRRRSVITDRSIFNVGNKENIVLDQSEQQLQHQSTHKKKRRSLDTPVSVQELAIATVAHASSSKGKGLRYRQANRKLVAAPSLSNFPSSNPSILKTEKASSFTTAITSSSSTSAQPQASTTFSLATRKVFDEYSKKHMPPGGTFGEIQSKNSVMTKADFIRFMTDFGIYPGMCSKEKVDTIFHELDSTSHQNSLLDPRMQLNFSLFHRFITAIARMIVNCNVKSVAELNASMRAFSNGNKSFNAESKRLYRISVQYRKSLQQSRPKQKHLTMGQRVEQIMSDKSLLAQHNNTTRNNIDNGNDVDNNNYKDNVNEIIHDAMEITDNEASDSESDAPQNVLLTHRMDVLHPLSRGGPSHNHGHRHSRSHPCIQSVSQPQSRSQSRSQSRRQSMDAAGVLLSRHQHAEQQSNLSQEKKHGNASIDNTTLINRKVKRDHQQAHLTKKEKNMPEKMNENDKTSKNNNAGTKRASTCNNSNEKNPAGKPRSSSTDMIAPSRSSTSKASAEMKAVREMNKRLETMENLKQKLRLENIRLQHRLKLEEGRNQELVQEKTQLENDKRHLRERNNWLSQSKTKIDTENKGYTEREKELVAAFTVKFEKLERALNTEKHKNATLMRQYKEVSEHNARISSCEAVMKHRINKQENHIAELQKRLNDLIETVALERQERGEENKKREEHEHQKDKELEVLREKDRERQRRDEEEAISSASIQLELEEARPVSRPTAIKATLASFFVCGSSNNM